MNKIAFVGNPNAGKTAIINALSGANFKVGNWPGVTIEKKEATIQLNGKELYLVDLPGVYSFDKMTNEERITRDYLMNEQVDLVVNVVDATNLERHLYLTMLLREMGVPMILVLNFQDELEKLGYQVNSDKLGQFLGVPVCMASAVTKTGMDTLKQWISEPQTVKDMRIHYSNEIETIYLEAYKALPEALGKGRCFVAMSMLSGHDDVSNQYKDVAAKIEPMIVSLESTKQEKRSFIMQYARFHYIQKLVSKVLTKSEKQRLDLTRKIDRIVLHRWYGLPLFLIMTMLLLSIVFNGSAPFMDWLEGFINGFVGKYVGLLLISAPSWIHSLIVDGIIGGVGGVIVFTPLMFVLYMLIAILEETGYMSRIAFLLDRLMRVFGLSGKTVIPMILGFGCSVPGIYATRTLDDPKARKKAALMVPFMSCGARLPIYGFFAGALFGPKMGIVVVSMYLIGVFVALIVAFLMSKLVKTEDKNPLIIELPPYRLPSAKYVVNKAWKDVVLYLKKVTGIVFVVLVILWGLTYFPNGTPENSFVSTFGNVAAPIFKPAGFGEHWQLVASIPGSIAAKETAVGFLSQVLDTQQTTEETPTYDFVADLKDQVIGLGIAAKDSVISIVSLQGMFGSTDVAANSGSFSALQQLIGTDAKGQLVAFSYMVFMLLIVPCVATLAAIKQEFSKKFMFQVILLLLAVPYVLSVLIFQIGTLFIR